jgi:hypothetical protein
MHIRKPIGSPIVFVACVLATALAAPAGAAADQPGCQEPSPTYTDPCGPSFVLPGWGDAGGWKHPDQYSTIQLADVDGDKRDELLGRTPAGLEVWDFDTALGQWRPQVDDKDLPVVLTAFASHPPAAGGPGGSGTDWTQPQYYDTIQAADIDGDGRAEILARAASGMIVLDYTPGPPGKAGSWRQLTTSGPFSDADGFTVPSAYTTIQFADIDGDHKAELIGRSPSQGLLVYRWNGSGWTALPGLPGFSDAGSDQAAPYYTTIQFADVLPGNPGKELVARDQDGLHVDKFAGNAWQRVSVSFPRPFPDATAGCCFSNGHRWPDSPSYFETITAAQVIAGPPGDQVLARGGDGLVMLRPTVSGGTLSFSEERGLPGLSDAAGWTKDQYWRTIQYADIDGDHTDELLARGPQGLLAYKYDPGSKTWKEVPTSTPLALTDDPWAKDPSYYSTIQTGDVDGDGRADVIGRGPYGIRTWFFNRRHTGGWERYLPEGYADFAKGQSAAFTALNEAARTAGLITKGQPTIRAVWTGGNAPDPNDLRALLDKGQGLPHVGNCTSETSVAPPAYASCTPPPDSTFAAADWTLVVNEMLAEAFWAQRVLDHFNELAGIRRDLFISQGAALPAIGNDLKLAGAAENNANYDLAESFSTMTGIAASIAGLGLPVASAGLWVVSELMGALASSSPTLTSSFDTRYAGLAEEFAKGVDETTKAMAVHSALVRGDQGLLTLVGQLRQRGTWQLDTAGMESAGREGFALWVYKTLLPTVYVRYNITNCRTDPKTHIACSAPPAAPWRVGSDTDFTVFAPPPTVGSITTKGTPCDAEPEWDPQGHKFTQVRCQFVGPDATLGNLVWGQLAPNCAYQPGNPNTEWVFGCSLGVDPQAPLEWDWPVYTGSPAVFPAMTGIVRLKRGMTMRVKGRLAIPRSVRLGRARVIQDRVLFERRGAGELSRLRGKRLVLVPKRRAGGRGVLFAGRGARLRLRRVGRATLSFVLRVRDRRSRALPAACSGTRPGIDLATHPIRLDTRLRIDDGRGRPVVLSFQPAWHCHRDRLGMVRTLHLHKPRRPVRRGRALRVRIRGPRQAALRTVVTYTTTVRNPGPATAYDVILHQLLPPASRPTGRRHGARVRAGRAVWRFARLPGGHSRTVRLAVRVPRAGGGRRWCSRAVAEAMARRVGRARTCARLTH